jgi:plasmid stabilization system protein ParE
VDFKIRFSEASVADLDEILAYSWANFPDTTSQFGAALLNQIELLSRFPYLGSPAAGSLGVRVLVHTPIRIYYRVFECDRVVEITEIRHASRR